MMLGQSHQGARMGALERRLLRRYIEAAKQSITLDKLLLRHIFPLRLTSVSLPVNVNAPGLLHGRLRSLIEATYFTS